MCDLRNIVGFELIVFAFPFVFIGGPRSHGDMLIVRTSRFLAAPETQKQSKGII